MHKASYYVKMVRLDAGQKIVKFSIFSKIRIFWEISDIFLSAYLLFFFNWDSLHARLNSHYKAWSYKKKKHKKIKAYNFHTLMNHQNHHHYSHSQYPCVSAVLFVFLWSSGLVVKALDSHYRGPVFKTTGWLKSCLSCSSFPGW